MEAATENPTCVTCHKGKSVVRCEGCMQIFCYDHLNNHRQEFYQQFQEIQNNHDLLREELNKVKEDPRKHSFIQEIDQWESNAIELIQKTAQTCREKVLEQTDGHFKQMAVALTGLKDQMTKLAKENDLNEIDLNFLRERLRQLDKEFNRIPNMTIAEDSTTLVPNLSILLSARKYTSDDDRKILFLLFAAVVSPKKKLFKLIILGRLFQRMNEEVYQIRFN